MGPRVAEVLCMSKHCAWLALCVWTVPVFQAHSAMWGRPLDICNHCPGAVQGCCLYSVLVKQSTTPFPTLINTFPPGVCRELVDDKIAVKEVPKDLKKLATKVLETEQATESKVADKAKKVTDSVKKDVQKAADNVRADFSKAADNVSADVNKAAEKASKESEKTIDAAKDTVDLVRAVSCMSTHKVK